MRKMVRFGIVVIRLDTESKNEFFSIKVIRETRVMGVSNSRQVSDRIIQKRIKIKAMENKTNPLSGIVKYRKKKVRGKGGRKGGRGKRRVFVKY